MNVERVVVVLRLDEDVRVENRSHSAHSEPVCELVERRELLEVRASGARRAEAFRLRACSDQRSREPFTDSQRPRCLKKLAARCVPLILRAETTIPWIALVADPRPRKRRRKNASRCHVSSSRSAIRRRMHPGALTRRGDERKTPAAACTSRARADSVLAANRTPARRAQLAAATCDATTASTSARGRDRAVYVRESRLADARRERGSCGERERSVRERVRRRRRRT